MGIIAYTVFAFVDPFLAVGPLAPMMAIRGMALVTIATVFGLTWTNWGRAHNSVLGDILWQIIANCVTLLVAYTGGSESGYYPMLLLAMLGPVLFIPMTGRQAGLNLLVIASFWDIWLLATNNQGPITVWVTTNFGIWFTALLCCVAAFFLDGWRQRDAAYREELAALNVRLVEMDLLKTRFFQNVSHEFRTPLTLILNPIERMRNANPELPELRSIASNAQRLLWLTNQLLNYQRSVANNQDLPLRPIATPKLLLLVGRYFREVCKSKNIHFNTTVDGVPIQPAHSDPVALGDVNALETIACNLVSNALKHVPPGGSIEMGVLTASDSVRFFVRDDGPGVPEAQQERIFETFYQIDGSQTRATEGTGLGLSLVKELGQRIQATVGLDSVVGQGATFWVDLLPAPADVPLQGLAFMAGREAQAWALSHTQPNKRSTTIEPDTGQQTILVIDDHPDICALLEQVLDEFRVISTTDPMTAISLIEKHRPDLILSDWMMPHLGGIDLLRELRAGPAEFANTPVILLTAKCDEESRTIAIKSGADGLIGKPFYQTELLSLVNNLLALQEHACDVRSLNIRLGNEITKRQLAEGQFLHSQKLEAVGQLSAGLTHEMNNILMAILCSAELMKQQSLDSSKATQHVDRIIRAADRGQKLTTNLLGFARKAERTNRPILLDQIVSQVTDIIQQTHRALVQIEVRQGGDECIVHGNPDILVQMLLNLVLNSVDAMEGAGTVKLWVESFLDESEPPTPMVKLTVTDNGAGMSKHVLAKVFEPFFTTKDVGHGTGLGLSMVHGTVQDHGGQVYIESEPNQGTSVIILLPQMAAGSVPTTAQAPLPATGPDRPRRRGRHDGA